MPQQSPTQVLATLLSTMFDKNIKGTINPDNSIKIDYNPMSNPDNQANGPQQQTGQALQAASKAATPPSLEGIFDPNMIKMLMGNQVGVQDALQVPQALSNMGYQQALTQQADRQPEQQAIDIIAALAGRKMTGQQAMQQLETESADSKARIQAQTATQKLADELAWKIHETPSGDTTAKINAEKGKSEHAPAAKVQEIDKVIELQGGGPGATPEQRRAAVGKALAIVYPKDPPALAIIKAIASGMFPADTMKDIIAQPEALTQVFQMLSGLAKNNPMSLPPIDVDPNEKGMEEKKSSTKANADDVTRMRPAKDPKTGLYLRRADGKYVMEKY